MRLWRPLHRHHCPHILIRFINIRSNTCNQPSYSWSVWVSVLILTNSSLTLFINILLPFSILIKKKITSGKKEANMEDPQAFCLKCVSVFLAVFQESTYFMLLALSSLHDGSPVVCSARYFSPLRDAV